MNIPKASSRIVSEFTAIILAGPGTNLSPLTRNYVRGHGIEEHVPKALLPVGNKAMLYYPLAWLDAAGVSEVLVLCPASHRALMSHYIYSSAEFPSLHITIQNIDEDESMGTADVLREIRSSIQTDFIILPCDFIPPAELTLSQVLNSHRMDPEGPILTSLLYERGEVTKDGPAKLLVGLDERTKTLLHMPIDEPGEDVQLRMSLLWKCPSVKFTSRYLDSHVYVLKRTVLDLLAERTEISSIKEDLIPWLCRGQYRVAARRKYGNVLKPTGNPQALALEHSTLQPQRQATPGYKKQNKHEEDDLLQPPLSSRTAMSIASSLPASPKLGVYRTLADLGDTPVDYRCAYVIAKGIATRANTSKTYFDANRQCLREGSYVPPAPSVEPLIDPKSQISTDSLIGSSTRVGERSSIKKSVVGSHCTIGRNVRIAGCIIMDHVQIKDGAKLENCIISRHTIVEERCSAKECETATGVVLSAGGDLKGERIEQFEYDEDSE